MKVIDLLNKIANGEIPENIKYNNTFYTFNEKKDNYYENENCSINWDYVSLHCLNDEIEIIEDTPISKLYVNNELQYDLTPKEDKKIKRLGKCFFTDYDDIFTEWVATYNGVIVDKLNEIIERLNGEDNESIN